MAAGEPLSKKQIHTLLHGDEPAAPGGPRQRRATTARRSRQDRAPVHAPAPEAELPPQLREPNQGRRWPWAVGSVLLLLLLLLQAAWLERERLAQVAPLRPWLEFLCAMTDCDLPLRRAPEAVELAQHTVQSHPERSGALLIRAVLVNRAAFAQAFPVLGLTMMDLSLQPVAWRRFPAETYLAPARRGTAFAPGERVEVRLEVTDPGPTAVSFEFTLH